MTSEEVGPAQNVTYPIFDDDGESPSLDDYYYNYNYYYGNGTDGMYETYTAPQLAFVSLLCIFIIVGNTCVLAAIRLSENGRKSRMNFFIMHLAIADLLVGVLVSVGDLILKLTVEWHAGNVMCKLVQYMQAVVTYSSTYMLVSLSIDRFDAVARPMNFSRSSYQGRILVGAAWAAALIFAAPALFLYQDEVKSGRHQCWMDFPEYWHWKLFIGSISVVTFFIPAVIIAVCYIVIILIIWSKGHRFESNDSRRHSSEASTPTRLTINQSRYDSGRGIIPQAKIRTIKMTLIIVIVFTLCWSPFFLYNLLDVFEVIRKNNRLSTFIQSAAPLNSAANPIIYGIFSTRICRNLRRLPMIPCLRKAFCHCRETPHKYHQRSWRGRYHTADASFTTLEFNKRSHIDLRLHALGKRQNCNGRGSLSPNDHPSPKRTLPKSSVFAFNGHHRYLVDEEYNRSSQTLLLGQNSPVSTDDSPTMSPNTPNSCSDVEKQRLMGDTPPGNERPRYVAEMKQRETATDCDDESCVVLPFHNKARLLQNNNRHCQSFDRGSAKPGSEKESSDALPARERNRSWPVVTFSNDGKRKAPIHQRKKQVPKSISPLHQLPKTILKKTNSSNSQTSDEMSPKCLPRVSKGRRDDEQKSFVYGFNAGYDIANGDTPERENFKLIYKDPDGGLEPMIPTDKSLATRRPTGVPSVRKKLGQEDRAILSLLTRKRKK